VQSSPVATSAHIEVRGTILSTHAVDADRNLWTIRLSLPPGAGLPFWTRPSLITMLVEQGVIGFTAVTGNVELTLGRDPMRRERAMTGAEYLLRPGDTASYGPGVQQSIRNPVTEDTVLIISMISSSKTIPFDGLWTSEGYPIIVTA
jgi:quercetin dioxygenase-like cupin family protein